MGPVPFCPYRSRTVLPLPVAYSFAPTGPVPVPLPVPYRFAPTGPVPFCPYRSRTVLPVWAPHCFAHTGPVPFCSYGPRTVLLVPVSYRFARTGPVPFCPYRSCTVLPVAVPYHFALMLPLQPLTSLYRPRTVLLVPVSYRFARTGPVPFCPYRSCTVLPVAVPYHFALMLPLQPLTSLYRPRTVLPVPVPYRFARTGPVPFCPYRSRTVLPSCCPYYPLRHHGAGCSTPFTFLLRLVSLYRSFQLYFIPKIIPTIPLFYISFLTAYFYLTSHSPVFIYNTALLYIVLLAHCGHLQTQRVCRALHPVSGEDGILVAEVPRGVQHASSPRTSPRRVVGLARPSQSAGRALS